MMSFLSAVITSCYPTTNNQLRNSSNPRQQATINDRRVTLQPVQGRQISFAMGTTRTYTPGASRSNSGKQRTVICYNYKGEGHMSKQCIKPKRKQDDTRFKDKVLLVQAQANGQILHEEELAFLADPRTAEDFDKLTAMASEHSSSEPALHEMTLATISSGLVPNTPPSTPPEVIALIAEVVAQEPAASTGSPSSITVDQDAPSPSNSQTSPKTQSPVISNDVEVENHDLDVAHMNNDPLFGILIPKNDSEYSSSDVIPTVVHTAAPNSEHINK
ncbi:integrase, catalytic region, zinc finger, CCHC-type containing protein [Tanacetum coccineum]